MKNVFRLVSVFLARPGLIYTLLILIPSLLYPSLVIAQDITQLEMTIEELQFKHQPNDLEVLDLVNTRQFKTLTDLNCRRSIGATASLATTIPVNSIIDNKTEKVAWNSNDPSLSHVGIINNGLWIMVSHKNQQCFVRASKRYLSPISSR